MQESIDVHQPELDELKSKRLVLASDVSGQLTDRTDLEVALDGENEVCGQLEEQIAGLHNSIDAVRGEMAEYLARATEQRDALAAETAEVDAVLQSKIDGNDQRRDRVHELSSELKNARSDSEVSRTRFEAIVEETERMRAEQASLQSRRTVLLTENAELEKYVTDLSKEIVRLDQEHNADMAKITAETNNYKQIIEERKQYLDDYSARKKGLRGKARGRVWTGASASKSHCFPHCHT